MSVLNESTFKKIEQQTFVSPLQPSPNKLRSYTGQDIKVLGTSKFVVRYGDKNHCLSLHVVKGGGPNLLGRNWLTHLKINFCDLNVIKHHSGPLKVVLDKHPAVFSDA